MHLEQHKGEQTTSLISPHFLDLTRKCGNCTKRVPQSNKSMEGLLWGVLDFSANDAENIYD